MYWWYVTAPTSICISVLSVQQVKYSALNTSYSIQLKEAFNLLRSDILSCTFKLIVSYWTNFFSCYELQTLSFGHWPQQFRARHSSYWQKRINTWNVIIFLCHHHPFDCCINLILVCEINHLEIWLESVMNALNANDIQNNSPHLVPPTKYCSWSLHSSLPSLFGGRGWSYPSKSAIVLLIMAATALVWYFSIKSLAKSIENSFANGKTIN